MKKRSAQSYLITGIFCVILTGLWTVTAWPFFISRFLSFPELEEAVVYEGKLHIEGKGHDVIRLGVSVPPRYFVVDKNGVKHKVFFGLYGDEQMRYDNTFEGIETKVWFHPIFGVINEQSYPTDKVLDVFSKLKTLGTKEPLKKGVVFGETYQEYKEFFNSYLSHKQKYAGQAMPFIATILLMIYNFFRYFELRKLEKEHNNG